MGEASCTNFEAVQSSCTNFWANSLSILPKNGKINDMMYWSGVVTTGQGYVRMAQAGCLLWTLWEQHQPHFMWAKEAVL